MPLHQRRLVRADRSWVRLCVDQRGHVVPDVELHRQSLAAGAYCVRPDVRGRVPSSATQARPFAFAIAAFGYWLAMWLQGGGILSPAVVYTAALLFAAVWFVLGIFERRFTERTNYKWFIVQLPLLWIGLEVLFQDNLLVGSNYWIGYRMAALPQVIQPVSILSSPALGFLIIMVNAAIALAILKLMDKRWPAMADVKIPAITVKWSSITTGALVIVWVASSLAIFCGLQPDGTCRHSGGRPIRH